jgi:5-methylcytosine-specific restriction endonuclease McrA
MLNNKWFKLRFEAFKRDNFTCQYCGRNVREDKIKLHCDHIIPRNKGGLNIPNNLITSCKECNLGKGDVLLEEHYLKNDKE